jgi:RNA polymerase sigma factor (TIGR02999 family)
MVSNHALTLQVAGFAVKLVMMNGDHRESRNGGDGGGIAPALLAACYDDVRRIARRVIATDGMNRALQATELANEAAIRLMGMDRMEIKDKAHMLAMAARTMRRILIDEARKGSAAKRQAPTFITQWPDDPSANLIDIGDLDRALIALEGTSPEHAQIVELRFMLGLTVGEAALASGIPERTIKRRWQAARAWLLDYLNGESGAALNPA